MTEAEWLACENPHGMRDYVATSSSRKMRLFVCVCCRRIHCALTERGIAAIDLAERFADGDASHDELLTIRQSYVRSSDFGSSAASGLAVRLAVTFWQEQPACLSASNWSAVATGEALDEWKAHAALLREIIGNPFRPVTFSPSWRTDTAVALARQIYESRDFSAMPILADALQDAGCDNADILDHCRGDGPHVRGCWVVDLVLGKE
jgi:hypothetical protein